MMAFKSMFIVIVLVSAPESTVRGLSLCVCECVGCVCVCLQLRLYTQAMVCHLAQMTA